MDGHFLNVCDDIVFPCDGLDGFQRLPSALRIEPELHLILYSRITLEEHRPIPVAVFLHEDIESLVLPAAAQRVQRVIEDRCLPDVLSSGEERTFNVSILQYYNITLLLYYPFTSKTQGIWP